MVALKLGERLLAAAALTRQGRALADIGTDHALLPVYLLLGGKIPRAVACDIGKGPLENARRTVEKYGVGEKVQLILSDGLRELEGLHLKDFVLTGMGGNLISDILRDAPFIKEEGVHLVLQPQSHAEDVREFLYSNGFEILREELASEGRHLYLLLEAEFTGRSEPFGVKEIYFGKLEDSASPLKYEYIRGCERRLLKRLNGLSGDEAEVKEQQVTEELCLVKEALKEARKILESEEKRARGAAALQLR